MPWHIGLDERAHLNGGAGKRTGEREREREDDQSWLHFINAGK